jgi:ATP-dependent helicase/nuclease subunit B
MTTEIILAPVGAGKTESVLNRLAQTIDEHPFAKVWALLATKRQEDAFRQRLSEWDNERQVFFNVEFLNFYELYQHLLDVAGVVQRQLGDSARLNLLRTIISAMRHDLEVFGTIAHTPGFVRIVAEFIYELKQNGISPDDYIAASTTAKDRDLSRIYVVYQEYLQNHNLVDREGQGWLAATVLEENTAITSDLSLLLVDGFDQFTSIQAEILGHLAQRADDTLITLTRVTEREKTVGRRFERALSRLKEQFGNDVLITERHLDHGDDGNHPDLRHLIDNIFLRNATPIKSYGGISLIEAPDTAAETGAVLRHVKRLILENKIEPDDILIALRDWENYRVHFSVLGKKYGLPLSLHYGQPLLENPAIIALLNLLQLHETGFRSRDLLDTLRSPYFAFREFPPADVDLLERISLQFIVTGGREQWLRAIKLAKQPSFNEYGEKQAPLLDEGSAEYLHDTLAAFFDAVIPRSESSISEYVQWLENLIGEDTKFADDDDLDEYTESTLNTQMIDQLRDESAPEEIIARDLAAMTAFKRVLQGLLAVQKLVGSLDEQNDTLINWATFSADLLAAVESTAVNPRPGRWGRVLVTTAANARGLPHKHVFVLGLSEGLFPARVSEDPLYLEGERQRLQSAGLNLETRAERSADEGLFYELICLPRHTLTLSRPSLQDGKHWAASPLWRAVTAIFDNSEELIQNNRVAIGEVIAVDQVASYEEAAISVTSELSHAAENISDDVWAALNWLRNSQATYWNNIDTGRRIESGRISSAPHNQYTGKLEDEHSIAHSAAKFADNHMWSASQFNDYGLCGYRFFAKRLLQLEALEEPEEGMDAAQYGTVNHEILEKTYDYLQQNDMTITDDNLDHMLAILRDVATDVLADAPHKLGFRADALWEHEKNIILRKLEKLVELDFTDSPIIKKFGAGERTPFMLEAPFGTIRDKVHVELDLGNEVGSVKLLGFIDRIDKIDNSAIIIDYKSGSTKIPTSELEAGRNFQMMVYLFGADAILQSNSDTQAQLSGGVFWHIRDRKVSGDIRLDDKGEETIAQAKTHLVNHIKNIRQGYFPVQPAKMSGSGCGVSYCDFERLCRVNITSMNKEH